MDAVMVAVAHLLYRMEYTLAVMLSLATRGCKYLRRVTYRIVGLN